MKVFLFVLLATILEAAGDAIIRIALHPGNVRTRILCYVIGSVLVIGYGTTLNLAPVEFATVTGLYVAMVFVSFQVSNYIFFGTLPHMGTLVGGALIVAGGAVVYLWR